MVSGVSAIDVSLGMSWSRAAQELSIFHLLQNHFALLEGNDLQMCETNCSMRSVPAMGFDRQSRRQVSSEEGFLRGNCLKAPCGGVAQMVRAMDS